MSVRTFVDTNVLVYAHDAAAGERHEQARSLIERLWEEGGGVVSTQVLQELYVNVRRKARRPLGSDEARRLVEDYMAWDLVVNDGDSILGAFDLETRYQLSFWDALVVQAAIASACEVLCSEDLSHGRTYGAVRVENPFAAAP